MSIKEDVHRLVDELPDDELPSAQRLLESLLAKEQDPLVRHLMQSPIDDEPYTAEERARKRKGGRNISVVKAATGKMCGPGFRSE